VPQIGNCRLVQIVGRGTFALVYRAVQAETGNIVAVKVLRDKFIDHPAVVDQFLREGEIGKTLDHPNIVAVHQVLEQRPPAIVMEFVEGTNLRDRFRTGQRYSRVEALRVVVDILSGINHLAQRGMTHRDLKMSNVLISERGPAKLFDFGLAEFQSSAGRELVNRTRPRSIDYVALERASHTQINDPRSDLYFVGVILYTLLAGISPIGRPKDRVERLSPIRFQNIRPIATVTPALGSDLASLVMRSLELNPDNRYGSAVEMLTEANSVLARLEMEVQETIQQATSGG